MKDTVKLLVVHEDATLPSGVSVSVQELREAILNNGEAFINALQGAIQGSVAPLPVAGGGGTGGALPMDTPLPKMVSADLARLLSPAAQKLVKADLIALTNNTKTAQDLGLTVADLQTIQDTFHLSVSNETRGLAATLKPTGGGVSCCCCSPCCCSTAATVTKARRAA